jgi:hypothetical protein
MRIIRLLILFVLLATLGSAQPAKPSFVEIQRSIVRYMECIECQSGELDTIIKKGDDALPYLEAILMRGPSGGRKEAYRQKLREDYAALEAYNKSNDKLKVLTPTQYESYYLSNFINTYRIRAAIAMHQSGAKERLDKISKDINTPAEVKYAIEEALR